VPATAQTDTKIMAKRSQAGNLNALPYILLLTYKIILKTTDKYYSVHIIYEKKLE
jgi:hypothetical protein